MMLWEFEFSYPLYSRHAGQRSRFNMRRKLDDGTDGVFAEYTRASSIVRFVVAVNMQVLLFVVKDPIE
jgi:hypothetical protein